MTITGIIWHCFTVFGKRCVMADTFQMSTKDQCEKKPEDFRRNFPRIYKAKQQGKEEK